MVDGGNIGEGESAAAAGLSLDRGAARVRPPRTGGSFCCPCRGAGALRSATKISGETWVALDYERGAGPLRPTSAKLPLDTQENRFLASEYDMFSFTLMSARSDEAKRGGILITRYDVVEDFVDPGMVVSSQSILCQHVDKDRHILQSLGLRYETQRGEKVDVPLHIREMLQISPIPKHMHPLHDAKRREARAKALGRTLKKEEGVAYVDVAEYKGRGAMAAAVVNGDGHLVASCSVKADDPETAEEVAVALALSMPGVRIIVWDSQSALRHPGNNIVIIHCQERLLPRMANAVLLENSALTSFGEFWDMLEEVLTLWLHSGLKVFLTKCKLGVE
ncbi:hypothetical protein HPB47_023946 [Ixodes persulcatus]|uniref:Uncharacterized protein n=1 Tax=Ixodes persulcatus TaxID=34615 RepID=A0AC60Q7J2_IXOPE|nr:hypothetical protein HPB47_023946 [Ixodes persulcatus]